MARRVAGAALVVGLLGAGAPVLAAPAYADSTAPAGTQVTASIPSIGDLLRGVEVDWAEGHWNWTAWNDPTPVAFGGDQPNYQCAEYVARSLAAAGLVPGLSPDDPQDDYFHYTAPWGTTYDLLLISDVAPYHNLYDYLMDSHLGTDVGDHPEEARPGDVVVTYADLGGTKSHAGLVATAPDGTNEATVDAHNRARQHYGYHFYAPSHLIRIEPLGLLDGLAQSFAVQPGTGATAGTGTTGAAGTTGGTARFAAPNLMAAPKAAAPKTAAPKAAVPAPANEPNQSGAGRMDPAGPQV
ncbi:hypothetical protein [Kitasatospora sp. LaBMicrA B282]|uniref:hypothetical protein n=1 Tax=Kitasatospora sp. LaBMicrA B282 TaxID=3420949 RepID=UPI003D0CC79D